MSPMFSTPLAASGARQRPRRPRPKTSVTSPPGAYLTLTANVAGAALQLASLDTQLDAANAIAETGQRTLEMLKRQQRLGEASTLDVANAESTFRAGRTARAAAAETDRPGTRPAGDPHRSFAVRALHANPAPRGFHPADGSSGQPAVRPCPPASGRESRGGKHPRRLGSSRRGGGCAAAELPNRRPAGHHGDQHQRPFSRPATPSIP